MRGISGPWVTGFGRAIRVTIKEITITYMIAKVWVLVKHGLTKLKKSPYSTVYVSTIELI